MTIRADSYSSTTAVLALSRSLLNGETAFNSTTQPTAAEVEGFIDEVSGILNMALRSHGWSPANITANSTAKLACDSWVRGKTVSYVNLTQPYQGFEASDVNPASFIYKLSGSANDFVQSMSLGFDQEGITRTNRPSDGLIFTGQTAQRDRLDRDDSSLEQPLFARRQFDSGGVSMESTAGGL